MAGPQWCFDDFRLDPDNACLWRDAQALALTPKAFDVLHYLLTHADRLITKDTLLDAVWPETAISDTVVRIAIGELRRVLGDTAQAPRFIATVHRRGYRFIAPVILAETAVVATASASPPPLAAPAPWLVGRTAVLARLHAALGQAQQGERQVLWLTGEPGIGNTAVIEAFARQAKVAVAVGQCIEHYGPGEPYLPVLEALGQLCRRPQGAHLPALLRRQAPTWLVQMPWLLSPVDRTHLHQELQGHTRERMLREFAMMIETLTAAMPLVLVLEDLHWSDHATLDLVTLLARRRDPARLLVLGTYRPVEALVREHPLRAVTQDLQLHGHSTALALEPLDADAVAAYLAARCPGGTFPAALVQWLTQCTEGNPLFVVQVVAHLVAHGVLVEDGGQWACRAQVATLDVGVPENLRQMIAQQCARLAPAEQDLLAAGSVVGVEFPAAAIAAGLGDEVGHIEAHCEALAQRGQVLRPVGIVEWPDGTVTTRYAFQHALYQQVMYEQLGAARRVRLHRHIGMRLEQAYGERAAEVAAELAEHFVRGRVAGRAVQYRQLAADTGRARHAHYEAITHLQRALEMIRTLPDTPARRDQELHMLVALGASLMITRGEGTPAVEQAYGQAYRLCQQVEDVGHLLPVLAGLQRFYLVRADHQRSVELGERLLSLATRLQEQAFQLEAHGALGATRLILGHFSQALRHHNEVRAHYVAQPTRSVGLTQDLKVGCLAGAARTLWCLGYPEQALARSREALAFAHSLAHPYSLMWSQLFAAEIHQYRGDLQAAQQAAEASLSLATTQGFQSWIVRGRLVHGLILTGLGRVEEGITEMQQGLEAQRATGETRAQAYFLTRLAEVYLHTDQPAASLACLTEALALIEATGERWWEAECHRVHGALLVLQACAQGPGAGEALPPPGEAETCLRRAMTLARSQDARSLELRAAISLSHLWRQQGRQEAAQRLLAEVYGWFTEGFDTADLRQAKALLEEWDG